MMLDIKLYVYTCKYIYIYIYIYTYWIYKHIDINIDLHTHIYIYIYIHDIIYDFDGCSISTQRIILDRLITETYLLPRWCKGPSQSLLLHIRWHWNQRATPDQDTIPYQPLGLKDVLFIISFQGSRAHTYIYYIYIYTNICLNGCFMMFPGSIKLFWKFYTVFKGATFPHVGQHPTDLWFSMGHCSKRLVWGMSCPSICSGALAPIHHPTVTLNATKIS